jgi:Raf kinase inhibitor-like YbhB/YbcL family protein
MRRDTRLLIALGCALAAPLVARAEGTFDLRSPAFDAGAAIPGRFTCEGENLSPPLAWSDPPPGTRSFALAVVDPDAPDPAAPRMTWIHWVVYAIPVDVRSLDEGASRELPGGARSGRNDWKSPDYGGPCPPIGRHRYVHQIWALDVAPANWGSPSLAALLDAMKGHVLGKAELVGTYEKQKR